MSLKLGSTNINQLFLGSTEIKKAYLGSTLVFDNSADTSLEFAWSFTKRVPTAVNSLRIRRSNDDAETDILLESSGVIDINSTVSAGGDLTTWIGSNDGFMVTDYDQTGNGHDFTQSAKTQQARVVLAGAWLGYKSFDGVNDIYFTTTQVNNTAGSVYIKVEPVSANTKYFLSQAKPTGTNSNKLFSLATSFSSGNKARILAFDPTVRLSEASTALNGIKIITYRGLSSSPYHSIRVDSSNETLSQVAMTLSRWFGDFTDTGFTLQKGRLNWNSGTKTGVAYREYEILGYNVEHNDTESLAIENTM